MKRVFFAAVLVITAAIAIISCKKDPAFVASGNEKKAPFARAGFDQFILLPTDSTWLDGSTSGDPDGTLSMYKWTKVEGPVSVNLSDEDKVRAKLNNLVEGHYIFELKVTDNDGLFSRDSIQVIVSTVDNHPSPREIINVDLATIGHLSDPRIPVVAAAGSKVIFAGGWNTRVCHPDPNDDFQYASAAIDIYDVKTHRWAAATLSKARADMAAVSAGNKIFFAGGSNWINSSTMETYSNVDIYNVVSNTWTVAHLSQARTGIAATVVGSKVIFAGGNTGDYLNGETNRVDVYDLANNQWSTDLLSVPRMSMSAITVNNKAYFSGGVQYYWAGGTQYHPNKTIDIYDNNTNAWSTASLTYLSGDGITGIATGNDIYWSGILRRADGYASSYFVETMNAISGESRLDSLSIPSFLHSIILQSDEVVFFPDNLNHFEIYNTARKQWYNGTTPANIFQPAVINFQHIIYAGGGSNGNRCSGFSNAVYMLTW
jgi:hypothetical protein